MIDTMVGCAVWDRAWCLNVWFQSLRANVDPKTTALVFVVYSEDHRTRELIAKQTEGFALVEIVRHKGQQFGRRSLEQERFKSLADARNSMLKVACSIRPSWYVSWDANTILPPNSLEKMRRLNKPATTIWTWLNRQAPRRMMYNEREVEFQDPMFASALAWASKNRTTHLPGGEWEEFTGSTWRTQVLQGFALLSSEAYLTCSFGPHEDGEFAKLSMDLARRGFEIWCYGDETAVNIQNQDELHGGYGSVLSLAEQIPLAAQRAIPQDDELQTLGLFPTGE